MFGKLLLYFKKNERRNAAGNCGEYVPAAYIFGIGQMQKRAANGRSRGIVFGQSVFVVSAADAANGKRSNCRGYAVQSANVFKAENVIRIV